MSTPLVKAFKNVADAHPEIAYKALEAMIASCIADGDELEETSIIGRGIEYYRDQAVVVPAGATVTSVTPASFGILHTDFYSDPIARTVYDDGMTMLSLPDNGFGVARMADGSYQVVHF